MVRASLHQEDAIWTRTFFLQQARLPHVTAPSHAVYQREQRPSARSSIPDRSLSAAASDCWGHAPPAAPCVLHTDMQVMGAAAQGARAPLGGAFGKSVPSTSFILKSPPSYGVPTACMQRPSVHGLLSIRTGVRRAAFQLSLKTRHMAVPLHTLPPHLVHHTPLEPHSSCPH